MKLILGSTCKEWVRLLRYDQINEYKRVHIIPSNYLIILTIPLTASLSYGQYDFSTITEMKSTIGTISIIFILLILLNWILNWWRLKDACFVSHPWLVPIDCDNDSNQLIQELHTLDDDVYYFFDYCSLPQKPRGFFNKIYFKYYLYSISEMNGLMKYHHMLDEIRSTRAWCYFEDVCRRPYNQTKFTLIGYMSLGYGVGEIIFGTTGSNYISWILLALGVIQISMAIGYNVFEGLSSELIKKEVTNGSDKITLVRQLMVGDVILRWLIGSIKYQLIKS